MIPPVLLGMWVFALIAYALPLAVNGIPFREGHVARVVRRFRRHAEAFIFFGRCVMPAAMSSACVMVWIAFIARPTEVVLAPIVLPLVPILMVAHFAWQMLHDRKAADT